MRLSSEILLNVSFSHLIELMFLKLDVYESFWYHMIQMWLLTRKSGFDPPSGSHQLPVFLKYSLRLKLLAQLVRCENIM